jgi:hypothetical protein
MKCIENKPLRNSTLAAKHDSNPQLLQIIENLKRELTLRDTIHSMAYLGIRGGVEQGESVRRVEGGGEVEKIEQVYYPTLTVNQKKSTVQIVGDILSRRSGKGVENGVPSPALKLNSLSQLTFLAEIMSQIVWEACENDAERVNYVYNKVVRGGGEERGTGSGDISGTEPVLERVDSNVENGVDYHGYHEEEEEEVEAEPRGITPPPTDLLRASTPPPALNIKLTFEQYIVTDTGTGPRLLTHSLI